jgi:hypothetical protein
MKICSCWVSRHMAVASWKNNPVTVLWRARNFLQASPYVYVPFRIVVDVSRDSRAPCWEKILLEQNWWPQLLSSQLPGVSSDSVCVVWFKLYAYDWCKQLLLDWQYSELSGCHIDRNTNCHSVVLTCCLFTKLKQEDRLINLTRCSGKFRYRLLQNSQLCSSACTLRFDFIIHFRKKKRLFSNLL